METGELIRSVRIERGLTQKELGDLCGMADSAIRRYESGRGNPTQKTLQRIAQALCVDPYSLYSWDQATEALEERINARDRVDTALGKLNDAGMEKAADAVEVIAEVPRYRAEMPSQPPPAPPDGTDTTPPPEGSEKPTDGPETPAEGE